MTNQCGRAFARYVAPCTLYQVPRTAGNSRVAARATRPSSRGPPDPERPAHRTLRLDSRARDHVSTTSAGISPAFRPAASAGDSLAAFMVRGAADAIIAMDS